MGCSKCEHEDCTTRPCWTFDAAARWEQGNYLAILIELCVEMQITAAGLEQHFYQGA